MMTPTQLTFRLLSDATFGRGDGVSGLVDVEVQHDSFGLPFYGGRALKGALVTECAEILFALEQRNRAGEWRKCAARLYGQAGSAFNDGGIIEVGDARLPEDVRGAIAYEVRKEKGKLTPQAVLASLTTIRHQTAMDAISGAPQNRTLRSMRLVMRDLTFGARLSFRAPPTDDDLQLLSACVKAVRRLGAGRNRGRGAVEARLRDADGNDITTDWFKMFAQQVVKP